MAPAATPPRLRRRAAATYNHPWALFPISVRQKDLRAVRPARIGAPCSWFHRWPLRSAARTATTIQRKRPICNEFSVSVNTC